MQHDKNYLFSETDGCLGYFHEVYPQSRGFEDRKKSFKIRNEGTASTRLYSENIGGAKVYYIKDFGGAKAINAIDLCMQEESLTFIEAVRYLYQFFKLEAATMKQFKPEWRKEPTEHPIDFYHIEYHEEPQHTKTFAPFLDYKTCLDYNFNSVISYQFVSYIKDAQGEPTEARQLNTVIATDNFPIFAFKEKEFVKIYKPKDSKAYRFQFFGNKPQRHIYGWDRVFNDYRSTIADFNAKIEKAEDSTVKAMLSASRDEYQIDAVFMASGGSDGLNLASLGYNVIWFNSESEQITFAEYLELKEICKEIYNVPDIDGTGVKQGVKLGLKHLEMKTIWLPLEYENTNKKDLRDWIESNKFLGIEIVKELFNGLIRQALEFRWWKWNKKTASYKYYYVSMMYFLKHHGFYVYKIEHENQQKGAISHIFIKIDGHVVSEVAASDIKSFVMDWLRERQINLEVLNMVIGSQFLNDKMLMALPVKAIDFNVATKRDQIFFFENKPVRVTADSIEFIDPAKIANYTWKNKILKHRLKITQQQFDIKKDAAGNWDIDILEKNNMYFNYLINASRVHWRADLETPFANKGEKAKQDYHNKHRFDIAAPNLSQDAIHEQKQHLINKIYGFGFLLHSYKDDAKGWCLYIMDNKIPDDVSDSKGGSGKSFGVSKLLDHFKHQFYMEGRNTRLTDNQFLYDGVDEDTDVIFVDDAHYSLAFHFFFSLLTGSMKVNEKHGKQFTLRYRKSPKLVITTNFVPANLDESTMRRLLMLVYSDYYHQKSKDYLETRQITDDFGGRKMFDEDFTQAEYSLFYNFCLQCLQFYLSCNERIDAPEGNVQKRNLLQVMGQAFKEWADGYFSEDMLDNFIPRRQVQDDYKAFVGTGAQSVNRQRKSLAAYCELRGWEFNPKSLQGSDDTIKKPIEYNGKRQILEHYYINTTGSLLAPSFTNFATPAEAATLFDSNGQVPDKIDTNGIDF